MKMKIRQTAQAGFSLMELMMVVALLTIIVGALFTQIDRAQVRYRVEGQKLDLTQQEREFIDQFTRDLHQAGFPSPAIYGGQYDLTSQFTAAGVWSVSSTEIKMEGDIDGDGVVDVVDYSYVTGPANCPCLRRSVAQKQNGLPSAQTLGTAFTEVEGLIAPASTANATPVFAAFDANGNQVSGSTAQVSNSGLTNVKSIRITLTTQGRGKDTDAHKDIQVTMTGVARLVNN